MTNLEALQASVIYPFEDMLLKKALFDWGLSHLEDYCKEVKREMDLATADLQVILITAPQITEGGYHISLTEKASLMKVASATYLKYGEQDPFATQTPTVTGINPW